MDIVNKIFPQRGDSLKVLSKLNKKYNEKYLYECEFIKYPCKIELIKSRILEGNVVNPLIEENEFVGKIYPQNCGDSLRVLRKTEEYSSGNFLFECEFLNYPCKILARKGNILKGTMTNYLYPSIFGKGYMGIGEYNSKNNFKIYNTWIKILSRCYNKNDKRYKFCGLKGNFIEETWLNFQNFAAWYEEHYVEGYELDKDVLFNIKHLNTKFYSPNTCIFIPGELNTFLAGDTLLTGITPLFKNRDNINQNLDICYQSILINNNIKYNLGTFNTFKEAKQVYAKKKYEIWKEEIDKFKLSNDLKEILLQYDFSWSWL